MCVCVRACVRVCVCMKLLTAGVLQLVALGPHVTNYRDAEGWYARHWAAFCRLIIWRGYFGVVTCGLLSVDYLAWLLWRGYFGVVTCGLLSVDYLAWLLVARSGFGIDPPARSTSAESSPILAWLAVVVGRGW
jgi:hypothetical protein